MNDQLLIGNSAIIATRQFSNLPALSVTTLKKYMQKATLATEKVGVKQSVPERFALMFDGWTANSTHYLAL